MEFAEATARIQSFANYETVPLAAAPPARFELVGIRQLLRLLDDPQQGRHTVHLTGSKGKGSVAAMVCALLRGCGFSTGLFTSPHLHTIRERIQIDGTPIPQDEFARLTELMWPAVERVLSDGGRLTTFELLTALGFLHFREQQAGWQVIEVGLGGTLDATNVLEEKDLCIFTPIGLEHTEVLGDTVAKIAADKAGILRAGARAVMGLQRESAAEVLRAACSRLDVPLLEVATACRLARGRSGLDDQEFRLQTPAGDYRLKLPLLGRFQQENAATAILGVEQLEQAGVALSPQAATAALMSVRWPARVEVLKRSPLVVVDGAHSADSARRLAQTVKDELPHRALLLVVGMSDDKNVQQFAEPFALLDPSVIAAASRHPRAASNVEVGRVFQDLGLPTRLAPDVAAAVDSAIGEAGPNDLVLVTGSLFVAAEAREAVLGLMPEL